MSLLSKKYLTKYLVSYYRLLRLFFLEYGLFDSISVNYRRFPLSIIEKDPKLELMQLDRLIDLDIPRHGSDADGLTRPQTICNVLEYRKVL